MPPDEFDGLLHRVRAGDEGALTQLVESYAGVVHRAARTMLGPGMRSQLDTLDLVQSVYRTLLIGLRDNKFDISSPDKLVALTLTLLRRKVARQWRTIKREPVLGQVSADDLEPEVLKVLGSTDADPAETVSFNDEVSTLLGQLDDIDRRLLELRLQGYTTKDAAAELGVDAGFLRVRLGRLRKRLREQGLRDDLV